MIFLFKISILREQIGSPGARKSKNLLPFGNRPPTP